MDGSSHDQENCQAAEDLEQIVCAACGIPEARSAAPLALIRSDGSHPAYRQRRPSFCRSRIHFCVGRTSRPPEVTNDLLGAMVSFIYFTVSQVFESRTASLNVVLWRVKRCVRCLSPLSVPWRISRSCCMVHTRDLFSKLLCSSIRPKSA